MFNLPILQRQSSSHVRPPQPFSRLSLEKTARTEGATVVESICPYCGVGCGLNIHTKQQQIINIEGNPKSPISEGSLCPKGANVFQLAVNPHRVKHVLYRAPYSDRWEQRPLDWAMDQIARRLKAARDEDLARQRGPGESRNAVTNVGTLGGATLDIEENYLIKKLFAAGLGVVSIENQARI